MRLDDPDLDLISELFDALGPTPRLCIEFYEDDLEDYREYLKALGNISIKNIAGVLSRR